MPRSLRLGLAQLNPIVGDVEGNIGRIRSARAACGADCDLVIFSELMIVGYPPEDLVLRPAVLDAARRAVETLAAETATGSGLLITAPWRDGDAVYNAALLLADGRIAATRYKHDLPNYGVFDEKRLFTPGPLPDPIDFRGRRLGVLICEDMWSPDATAHLATRGAEILIVPNGSPFERGKPDARVKLATDRVRETGLPLVYVNQVGGQDELVFDGGSFVVNSGGARAPPPPGGGLAGYMKACSETPRVSGADRRPARLRQQEWFSRCAAGIVWRHRLGADCRRCR
jgi:NAD+ synthase